MKGQLFIVMLTLITLNSPVSLVFAEDVRELSIEAEKEKEALIATAAREKAEALRQAEERRAAILQDRTRLENAIKVLREEKEILGEQITSLNGELDKLTEEELSVSQELRETDQVVNELVGLIRSNAKDIESLLVENHQMALSSESLEYLSALADESSFPGMTEIGRLTEALLNQVELTGQVTRGQADIIDRDGRTVTAEVATFGPFTAVYRLNGETGFLRYSSAGRKLYALSKLPPGGMQKQIGLYLDGENMAVPMDIARGAALQQLSHSVNLRDQIKNGGPIVYPILAIFIFGLLIVCERMIFFFRKHFDSDAFMEKLSAFVRTSSWKESDKYCSDNMKKPVARVIKAGIQCRELERQEMENVLQEAILREIPPLERFLSTLGMLAAIAPLLGLLGTVTGMIDTFHIITLHGTSDPRLMSGGISEALVTTMLGLGVAIPLMLAQTLLNRSVEKEIGNMEEKAVALVNIIHQKKLDDACSN